MDGILAESKEHLDPGQPNPDSVQSVAPTTMHDPQAAAFTGLKEEFPAGQSHVVTQPEENVSVKNDREASSASDSQFHTISAGNTISDPSSISELGRTYHGYKDGAYLLPNDAAEQDRLDIQHAAWGSMLDGALSLAPISEPANVLDIGTGTGIWALEFADQHPESVIYGTDLSQIQPWGGHPRVHWVLEDAEDDWAFFPQPFDYIHLRMMVTCFKDHKDVIKKVYDNLNPGGWVEYQEGGLDLWCQDGSTLGTAVHKWTFLMKAGAISLGRDLEVAQKYKHWLADTGFVDVTEEIILAPGNTWPNDPRLKDIGKWMSATAIQGIEGLSLKILHHGLGMPVEEIETLVTQVRKDIVNPNHKFYWVMRVVCGRKPSPTTGEPLDG